MTSQKIIIKKIMLLFIKINLYICRLFGLKCKISTQKGKKAL